MKMYRVKTTVGWDTKFWAILPAININRASGTFEFEWLCFFIYVDFIEKQNPFPCDCENPDWKGCVNHSNLIAK